jgi:hypothetical protein
VWTTNRIEIFLKSQESRDEGRTGVDFMTSAAGTCNEGKFAFLGLTNVRVDIPAAAGIILPDGTEVVTQLPQKREAQSNLVKASEERRGFGSRTQLSGSNWIMKKIGDFAEVLCWRAILPMSCRKAPRAIMLNSLTKSHFWRGCCRNCLRPPRTLRRNRLPSGTEGRKYTSRCKTRGNSEHFGQHYF